MGKRTNDRLVWILGDLALEVVLELWQTGNRTLRILRPRIPPERGQREVKGSIDACRTYFDGNGRLRALFFDGRQDSLERRLE